MTPIPSAALVTGAARGLGADLVRALRAAGVPKVYAGHRVLRPGTTAADGVVPIQLDVTDLKQVLAAADVASDVTLLVNNAGVLPRGAPTAVTEADLRLAMEVNYLGPLAMARAFAPAMATRGGGTVVNVLSLLSLAVEPGFSAYCASKWASWAMTQALRAELRGRRIKVAAAFPGGIDTDMLAGIPATKARPADVAHAIVRAALAGEEDIFPDPSSRSLAAGRGWVR